MIHGNTPWWITPCDRMQGKKNRAQFYNWLCYELTGVCKSKPPSLPKVGWGAAGLCQEAARPAPAAGSGSG